MKKFVVLLVVVAMCSLSAVAFAADISVSGQMDVRSKSFNDLHLTKDTDGSVAGNNDRSTQERVRLNIEAKAADVKGKISIENDWDTWGRLEDHQANASGLKADPATGEISAGPFLQLREAWINFNLPGIPVNVNVGHQLLQLGNGWFLRNMKYGDDAWVLANVTGNNTVAFVNIKASEGAVGVADDIDGYALLDVFKLNDTMTVGIDLTDVVDRRAAILNSAAGAGTFKNMSLQNIGLNFNGTFGPLNLKAEIDMQSGKGSATDGNTDLKFSGNQIVVEGKAALDPVTVNFTLAQGSGTKDSENPLMGGTGDKNKDMYTLMDADQHYTLLYEYKIPTTAHFNAGGDLHTGFENTTALNVGVSTNVTKGLNVGVDLWMLKATAKVVNGNGDEVSNIGNEIDAHANWQMYDNLSWNWQLGYFKPGDVYKGVDNGVDPVSGKDAATGIQGVLSFKF
jgi:hypothetical protein